MLDGLATFPTVSLYVTQKVYSPSSSNVTVAVCVDKFGFSLLYFSFHVDTFGVVFLEPCAFCTCNTTCFSAKLRSATSIVAVQSCELIPFCTCLSKFTSIFGTDLSIPRISSFLLVFPARSVIEISTRISLLLFRIFNSPSIFVTRFRSVSFTFHPLFDTLPEFETSHFPS